MNIPKLTPQQAFEKERAEKLSITIFPKDKIVEGFIENVHKAIKWNSILRLNCHDLTWRQICLLEREFRMPEIELCIQILRAATPVEMEQTLEENCKMLSEIVKPMIAIYSDMDDEISNPIKRKIETEVKISLSVPIGKKLFKDEHSRI